MNNITMHFFKVKFFPNKVDDYFYFCFSNLIFIIILIGQISFYFDAVDSAGKKNEIILLIPKTENDFEEKRDLIFNQLSIDQSIISIDKLKKQN